jgi:hypothetical protein
MENINYDKTTSGVNIVLNGYKNQRCESAMCAVRPHVMNSLVSPFIKYKWCVNEQQGNEETSLVYEQFKELPSYIMQNAM